MGVFLYSPGVKVYLATQHHGTLDVSADLTSGKLVRRSNGVSSFTFMLQNVRRKYDGIFMPNDRIIVMMKRLTWLRTFTGYLNSVPLVTAWPQDIQFTASCSLKRLQYFYWDPALASSQTLVAQAMAAAKSPDDGGTANAVLTLLNNVVGWPPSKVHIAGIPQSWVKWAYKIAKNVAAETAQADKLAEQFFSTLGGNGVIGGQLGGGVAATGALKTGTYGGATIDKNQAAIATLIYNMAVTMGGSTRDAAVGIMTSMTESALGADPGTNSGRGGSYGIFQQTPAAGWGTVAQVTQPSYAARAFYQRLLKIANRNSMTEWMEAQTVQRSAFSDGSNYQRWAALGNQIASVLSNTSNGSSSLGNSTAFQNLARQGKAGKVSGYDLLQTALNLVQTHPTIPYQEGGDSPPNTPAGQITFLDCSSFVQWVVFNATGSLNGCPRTADTQSSWCKSRGKIITAEQGMNTPGALMYFGPVGGAGHTEISLGDGVHTVGAHSGGTYAGVVTSKGYWSFAGLPPAMDYSGTPGGSPGLGTSGVSTTGVQLSPANQQPWYNPNDPFDRLFGSAPWVPQFDTDSAAIAAAFTGVRSLLPDSPLLPFIKNLITSCMRSFSSAPNGDLIAWFPDYYGLWGTAAVMRIEPVELQDFSVFWDDTNFVTHQYTAAPPAIGIDLATATLANVGPVIALTTTGVATIDIPGIMYALFGLEPTQAKAQKFIDFVYSRFGARPDYEQLPGAIGPQGEFFSALYLFMQNWAYQYNSDVELTFMPELWPGMLLQIPAYAFQAYTTTVTHSFQFGPGGYFNTTVNIAAPARLPGNQGDSSGNLIGLPIAGGLVTQPSMGG